MRFLLTTGRITEHIVSDIAARFDADVVVTGEVASFLQPKQLSAILAEKIASHRESEAQSSKMPLYDCIFVPGMCTASFAEVEAQFGIPIFRGPLHAADLAMILSYAAEGFEFSRTIPADNLLVIEREKKAYALLVSQEENAKPLFYLSNLPIGGGTRIKVLAEIMDSHRASNLQEVVVSYIASGADIIDLGFGFDATPADVVRVLSEVTDVLENIRRDPQNEFQKRPVACAIDTQEPDLIAAALTFPCVNLVLSLHEGNMHCAPLLHSKGVAAVIIPGEAGLENNMKAAQNAKVTCIADPVLHPIGSGILPSIANIFETHTKYPEWPLFFGAGNVLELIDADSIGGVGILAGIAHEARAVMVFVSEHSDKTRGCIAEMRRATEMMALLGSRPYPKDLGLDLLVIKEKRARREPPLMYTEMKDLAPHSKLVYDPKGNFRIGISHEKIVVEKGGIAVSGEKWEDLYRTIEKNEWVSRLDHAAYLGKELYKAELALRFKRSFEQDGAF